MDTTPEKRGTAKSEILYNPERLQAQIEQFKILGAKGLHVLADVDRTLTTAGPVPSIISQLRAGGYLGDSYVQKTRELFEAYHPIELDYSIDPNIRATKMAEWQRLHAELLVASGLTKEIFESVIANPLVHFRAGVDKFIKLLEKHGIPLVLISGAPQYLIEGHFRQAGLWHNNIHIIANNFQFDESGKLTGLAEPVINAGNKSTIISSDYSHHQEIERRRNVLLLGDNIDDLDMVQGFEADHLLTIGFLNKETNGNRRKYSLAFDAVITNDGTMDFPNEVLEKIIGAE